MVGIGGGLAHVMLHQSREGEKPSPVDPIHAVLDLDDAVHDLTAPNPAQDIHFTVRWVIGLKP